MRKKVYRTQKGKLIDMEAMRAVNEKTVAAGNMSVNAKGDEIKGGKVVKPARERIRPHQQVKTQVARTSIKPPIKKRDAQINTPQEPAPPQAEEAPKQEFVVDETPVSINEKTRADGSKYRELMFADGSIALEEVEAAPVEEAPKKKTTKKKVSKKKTSKKKGDDSEGESN